MSKKGRRMFAGISAKPSFSSFKKSYGDKHPYGDDWPTQSKLCKKRDDYRCRADAIGLPKCSNRFPGQFSHLLEAHHVIPFRKCKSNDLRNLITLCKDCHNKTHKHMNDREGLSDKQKKVSRYFR